MAERPALDRTLSPDEFREYYYLKEELADFCRNNGLPVSGGKQELTERIARFLGTGEILPPGAKPRRKKAAPVSPLTPESLIEPDFVCSEAHRASFREHIGGGFSFNVAFQKWLKANAGKTYADAIAAYNEIIAEKKLNKAPIDGQFEYNTYIRDFFEHNPGRSLDEAIRCWKYKKSQPGSNKYEDSDLTKSIMM